MNTQKPTWFDTFFEAVSSTPEYKTLMWWMSDISKYEAELQQLDADTKDFSEIQNAFSKTFDTPEAREAWKNPPSLQARESEGEWKKWWKTGNAKDEEEVKDLIEVKYFENKEPATWWFKWVAWMQDLKDELTHNFIQPLQFQFFAEKLKKASEEKAPLLTNDENNEDSTSIEKEESPLLTREGLGVGDDTDKLYTDLYEAYKDFKVWIPTGLLFYWPPWTGKTYITKKLAQELNAWFIKKSVWELGSSYVHQTSKNIHNFFKQAKAASQKWPIVLFLDEIDSLVSKRWWNVDASKTEEVSQFLQEFNNLEDAPNLVIVAATNRPDNLDSAILRSGRFDKKIYIGEPDFIARKELFEIFIAKKDRPHTKLDYRELAMLSEWYVAADIEAIVNEAARDASKWILDLAALIQKWDHDPEKIRAELESHTISMELLKQAIIDTDSSLKMVDMSIYTKWLENLES